MTQNLLDPDNIGPRLKALFAGTAGVRTLAGVATDDCSVIKLPTTNLILTSDFVNSSPIGLELGISTFSDLGYYLVASNISDLAGSGALPLGLLVNIMWSRNDASESFWEVMSGVKAAASMYNATVLGGDTKLTSGRTIMNAVAIGTADSADSLFLQGQAKVGYSLWVSGELGSCAAAVVGVDAQVEGQAWRSWAEAAIRKPVVPLDISRAVSRLELRAAGIDISDGLSADLSRMADESGVGVRVDLDLIPVAPQVRSVASRIGVHPGSFALTIGGDLQFALAAPFKYDLETFGMTHIGEIVESGSSSLTVSGKAFPMPQVGHRDAHGLSFVEEVNFLIRKLPFNDYE